MNSNNQNEVDYGRKWHVMLAVAMSVFLATIDGSIVNVALPTLATELNSSFALVQWVVLAYLLTQTTLMLGVGRLADMIGKKSIFTTGFVVFTVGSVLCGLSPNVYWLIIFRVVQAVGAAMTLALGIAIITEAFPPHERGKALGLVGGIVSVGIAIGPSIGGLLLDKLSWHWIFFVNLPIGIVGTIIAVKFVPTLRPVGKQKFDYGGAVTLLIALLGLLLALSFGQNIGFTDGRVLALFAVFIIFTAVFVYIQAHVEQPMIDLKLFRNQLFTINLLTGLGTFLAMSGLFILLPFYLEGVLGYGVREVGLLLAAVPVTLGLSAPFAGMLSDRFGTRPITVSGIVILLIAYYSLSNINPEQPILYFVLSLFLIGLGMGVFQSPNNSAIMGAAPRSQLGVASGLLSLTRALGQTAGIAISGAFWAGRTFYHAGEIHPDGATAAPDWAQVLALQEMFLLACVLIVVALSLGVWGLLHERRLPVAVSNPGLPEEHSTHIHH